MDLTLLDFIQAAGGQVVSVGKIADIFSNQGVSYTVKGSDNMALIDQLLSQMKLAKEGLIFVNLVDFDTKFGHRRDVAGYALALEQLDKRIIEIESLLSSMMTLYLLLPIMVAIQLGQVVTILANMYQ